MGDLTSVHLKKGPGEASALTPCRNAAVLADHRFDHAFWVVLDEGRVEKSIGLLGHRHGARLNEKWKLKVLDARPSRKVRTDDSECLAAHDGWLYVLGSHFGKKDGPLQARRQFIARFRESALDGKVTRARCPVEIARRPFLLHRVVNDCLQHRGLELIPMGPHARGAYLEKTLEHAFDGERSWGHLVRVEDWPINIEGLTFIGERALLGLRFPVTRNGEPIVVEVEGLSRMFDQDAEPPAATRAWALKGAGSRSFSAGVRGLDQVDGTLHVLTGPVGTALIKDYPGSREVNCRHWSFSVADLDREDEITPALIREFEHRDHVEGVAHSDGGWFYAADCDDAVTLHIDWDDRPAAEPERWLQAG